VRIKLLIALILIISPALTAFSQNKPTDLNASDQEAVSGKQPPENRAANMDGTTELSQAERDEAIQLGERFLARYGETKDIQPLFAELFVTDLPTRVKDQLVTGGSAKLDQSITNSPIDSTVVNFYGELDNFILLTFRMRAAYEEQVQVEGRAEVSEEQSWFPPQVIGLSYYCRFLKFLVRNVDENAFPADVDDIEQQDADEAQLNLNDAAALDNTIRTLKTANDILRTQVAIVERELGKEPHWLRDGDFSVKLTALGDDEKWMALPVGSKVICITKYPFHIDAIRENGRLRILSVSPGGDND
jgi:hypothetical protein